MNYAEMNYNICPSCKERGIPRGENGQIFACQVCQKEVIYKDGNVKILIKIENTTYNKHQQLQTFLDSLNDDELGFVTGYAHKRLDALRKI